MTTAKVYGIKSHRDGKYPFCALLSWLQQIVYNFLLKKHVYLQTVCKTSVPGHIHSYLFNLNHNSAPSK